MEDFKTKKIAVTFANADEQKRFLQECERAGLKTRSGRSTSSWMIEGESPIAATVDNPPALSFWNTYDGRKQNEKAEIKDGFTLVPFSSFTFAPSAPSYTPPLWAGIVTTETTSQQVNAMIDQLRKVRYDKQQAEQPKPAEKPAPKSWKPAAGDLVQIVKDRFLGIGAGNIVKIEKFHASGYPMARGNDGNLHPMGFDDIRPVREEDRPAKVGEWVEITKSNYSEYVYQTGDILKVIDRASDGARLPIVENKKGKRFFVTPSEYRVLVPYDPTEAAHA
jgi:hypothetical protein